MSIWRWSDRFDAAPSEWRLSLGEGNTPLLRSRRIGPAAGLANLFFKLETGNPTGSYKDRFAAAAVADMLARGKRRCVATSSGNTGAALAAYCAAAGLDCEIAIVETAPQEKLRQMLAYGARLYRIRGFGLDDEATRRAIAAVERRAAMPDAQLQISAYCKSPAGMRGVQTVGYELTEQLAQLGLSGAAAQVLVPAGGGGLTLAVARGLAGTPAAVHCVQPEGNATIAAPLRDGSDRAQAVRCTTRISGLQVPSVLDGDDVVRACRSSGGTGHLVDDAAVWSMQARLAREEGIFCEPAGAVATAAAIRAVEAGTILRGAPVVCVVTGSGFKDSESADRVAARSSCVTLDVGAFEALPATVT